MAVNWESTNRTLYKLLPLMTCSVCNNLFKDPCTLATCHHEFCRKCIESYTKCLQCNVPYWKKDIVPFNQLSTLVQHIELLQLLILTTPIATTPTATTITSSAIIATTGKASLVLKPINHRWAPPQLSSSKLSLKRKRRVTTLNESNKKELVSIVKRSKGEEGEEREALNDARQPITRQLITKSVSIKRNCVGETKLHVAVIKGDTSLVKRLLEEGADPNVTDNAGWTPLHEACNHGYQAIVELLISSGSLLNVPGYNNDTPLHDAVQNNHSNIVSTLIKAGAKTHLRNCQGHTPLDLAHSTAMKNVLSSIPTTIKDSSCSTLSSTSPRLSIKSSPVILGSGLTPYQKAFLNRTASKMGAKVVNTFSSQVTHVVTECDQNSCCSRTMKCLSAVAVGCWLLDFQWVIMSSKQFSWIEEIGHLVKGFYYQNQSHVTDSPLKGYNNAIEKLPGLFDGCFFYFVGRFSPPCPSKAELTQLIQYGGGTLLSREPKVTENDTIFAPYPFHAPPDSIFSTCHSFIISDSVCCPLPSPPPSPVYCMHLPLSWILDCLCQFKLVAVNE